MQTFDTPEGVRGQAKSLVTTMRSDAHTWNLVVLQLYLQQWGHDVLNLGPCVPEDLLLQQSEWFEPDLIVVSTVNGHGTHDARSLVRRLRGSERLAATRIVLGGKLGVAGDRCDAELRSLRDAGYDAVFPESATVHDLDPILRQLAVERGSVGARSR
ncbi:cobalamin B12-binding domain-containing protein [Salinispora arenicola]|uniref:cobalamin B12-binding domain-containing protein n=1 Tax=Salinispora arenicola TaxID=168697 RepID=UPI00035E80D7|nr:cobalamin-dependent protein [Salinispora arenicola]